MGWKTLGMLPGCQPRGGHFRGRDFERDYFHERGIQER